MSGIGRAVFLRPIEVTASNNSFSVDGNATAINSGVYGSLMTLCNNFVSKLALYIATPEITFDTSATSTTPGKITISNPSTFSITWTDTDLRDLLGFSGNLSGANSYTATTPPQTIWVSDYTPSDRDWWSLRHKDTFSGSVARTGELVGLANGNQIYYRKMRLDAETGANLFKSLTTTTWEINNCLENFVELARRSVPSTSSNLPTHGFYYMYNLSDMLSTYTSMEAYTGLTYNATKKWSWCHFDPDGTIVPAPSIGIGRDWYTLDIDLHTAAEPTWSAP